MPNLAHFVGLSARAFGRLTTRGAVIIAASIVPVLVAPVSAKTLDAPPITVDGSTVSVPSLQRNNAVFVPVRGVFEKLGADVSYTAPTSIAARKDGHDLARMSVGSRAATVNGTAQTLDVAPFEAQGHVMVPLRLISEAAGATVAYVASPRSVQITHRAVVAAAPAANPVASAAPVAAEEHQGIPWWVWPLIALAAIALILLFMRRRKDPIIRTSSTVRADPTIKTRR